MIKSRIATIAYCRSLKALISRAITASASEPTIDFVNIDKRENVTLIGLNRPHYKNAMNHAMAHQLGIAMRAFEEDKTSHVAILHGNGDSFCTGYDLKELSNRELDDKVKDMMEEPGPMGITRQPLKKPVIAALHGYVVGGGLELALACDLRIARRDTIIGGFNRKWGVPFIDGGTVRLPALIGLSRALDLILTGRPVLADEALSIGLINRVTDHDLIGAAFGLAKQISENPELCMLTDRLSAYYSAYDAKSFQDAIDQEFHNGWKVVNVNSIEGAKKFMKRKAKMSK